MKKPISITSLAMRFYRNDGWTEEILKPYLVRGEFFYFEKDKLPYWILTAGSQLNVTKLFMDGHIGELRGRAAWTECEGMTDMEVLQSRNW